MPANDCVFNKVDAVARRRLLRLHEPMRTRVDFYLRKIAGAKSGDNLTEADVNLCLGKAMMDRLVDQECFPNAAEIPVGKTRPLQELIDGIAG
jgi:hypothetical protein